MSETQERRGRRGLSEVSLTEEGQEIIASEGYRPTTESARATRETISRSESFSDRVIARDWSDAQQKFFAENGVIDVIYVRSRATMNEPPRTPSIAQDCSMTQAALVPSPSARSRFDAGSFVTFRKD